MKKHWSRWYVALACGLLSVAAMSAGAATTPKPTPVRFPSTFGSMHFPTKFPDGTTLTITQWSHFVPSYNGWFKKYAQEWGEHNNVKVTVNIISYADLTPTLSAAIAAKKGADLYQMIGPPASFVQGLQDLNAVNKAANQAFGKITKVCASQSYLPVKDLWYGYCHAWVPDPGDYLVPLWKKAGYPTGPHTYADLLKGGTKIFKSAGIPVGVGISPGIDSEFFTRSMIWSFGGRIFDKCGDVAMNSPQVVKAVEYEKKLFKNAMTPQVFSWNAASNNQGFVAGQLSYIQNSLSFYRTAQKSAPKVAKEAGFRPGLKGPGGQVHQTAHVYFVYVMPKYVSASHKKVAEKFLLDLTANASSVTYYTKLYDFPAHPKEVPQLDAWLEHDPFGSVPANKLNVLKNAAKWTAWPGFPGYANPAVSEVYHTHLLTTMMAEAVHGKKTPKEAVESTAAQVGKIVAKWKAKGYVGCRK